MLDDIRYGKVMFYHCRGKFTLDLLRESDNPGFRKELVCATCECPAERIVLVGKDRTVV